MGVNCIQLENRFMVSGSSDGFVKLWSKPDNSDVWSSLNVIKHSGPVTTIKFDDYKIASGSIDCTVVISDMQGSSIYTQAHHMNRINKLDFVDNMLVTCRYK
jgi:WD40 repeat protein